MGGLPGKPNMSVGLLAHVDAGKTTLSESILYLSGSIRKVGRVDHADSFLDTHELEKSRGITIFSKQAVFALGDQYVTLLDTPGHVDFSAEMERTLQVLDYGILIISAADGVQGHTRTLWRLLERYKIPTFLFVNKMDQEGTDQTRLMEQLRNKLDEGCVPFEEINKASPDLMESIAMCDEKALEEYLESSMLCKSTLVRMIRERHLFPCYFGSALKHQGVKELLEGLGEYAETHAHEAERENLFGARVYKISRDAQDHRLTHLKVTSGVLRVKDSLTGGKGTGEQSAGVWEEKVNQIRIYSGDKYETVAEAHAGMICAVTGLHHTYPGESLGIEQKAELPALEPVLNYQIHLPEGCDVTTMLANLRRLEEEDPMLRIVWNEELGEIHVRLMGEVQTQVLTSLIRKRFGVEVTFGAGSIVYKETISKVAEGVGHYEPLRHYAEVHILLEPGEAGSGLVFDNICKEDALDRNWQRLILSHLAEKQHRGVLTGSAITDMKITLAAGRAHLKHTEGGDFREATYRAVRQGLMQADCVLLEPYYEFCLEVPPELVGRAMTDIQRMNGEFSPPEATEELAVLTGTAPVAAMRDYPMEVINYTRGRGRLSCTFLGYAPCRSGQKVIEEIGYDPERDMDNPTGSVFCSHGAGYYVPWNEVPEHMHIESQRKPQPEKIEEPQAARQGGMRQKSVFSASREEDQELEEIFIRTYGKVERRLTSGVRTVGEAPARPEKKEKPVQEYLLVDGYNLIFAWEDLKDLAKINIEAARNKLMDILCNYQGFKKCVVILVFDAYKVEGDAMEIQKYHNIHVVYTREAETADQYIEKVVHEIGRKYHVTVVTSDGVEQVITLGQGGRLISSREFLEEVELTRSQIEAEAQSRRERRRNYLFDHMDEVLAAEMEKVRLGKKELGVSAERCQKRAKEEL